MSEWTVLGALDWTADRFAREGYESARLEAQVLLAHVIGTDRVGLYTRFDQPLDPDERARYRELIKRRLAGEPVAYLVAEQEFWSLPFSVNEAVLIPRPDTETVIEVVLDRLADRAAPLRVADVGTGSGALAVTLAKELGAAQLVATDVSERALEVARANAERNQVADRIDFRQGDLLEPIAGDRFDILVSNPPYVRTGELATLQLEVRREPRGALDGGPDGLALLRRLVSGASEHLVPGGLVALEHGHDQGEAVRALIEATGAFATPESVRDLGKRPRVTCARAL